MPDNLGMCHGFFIIRKYSVYLYWKDANSFTKQDRKGKIQKMGKIVKRVLYLEEITCQRNYRKQRLQEVAFGVW